MAFVGILGTWVLLFLGVGEMQILGVGVDLGWCLCFVRLEFGFIFSLVIVWVRFLCISNFHILQGLDFVNCSLGFCL